MSKSGIGGRQSGEHTTPCFFEQDPSLSLARRALAEGVGSLLLMMVATGAGLKGQLLSGGNQELGLLVTAIAISGALVGLIVAFGTVSGGHFNPLITCLQWLSGERSSRCTVTYVAAQMVGATMGALLANNLFDALPTEAIPAAVNSRWVLSELVASCGLMVIVFGCTRSAKALTGPFSVGIWLLGAIVATPSTSYANPAIAIAAILAAGPIGMTFQTAVFYTVAEIAGALLAYWIISMTYPRTQISR